MAVKKKDKEVEQKPEPKKAPELAVEAKSPVTMVCRNKVCWHSEKLHYEGRDQQCNQEGCRCNAFIK